jgi:hypothetical protein
VIKIRVLDAEHPNGVIHNFSGNVIKIGSTPTSHLQLSGKTVSRMHAVLEVDNPAEGHAYIIDLGSMGGTRVDGRKITKASLKVGSAIQIDAYDLHVLAIAETGTEDPAPKPAVSGGVGGDDGRAGVGHASPVPQPSKNFTVQMDAAARIQQLQQHDTDAPPPPALDPRFSTESLTDSSTATLIATLSALVVRMAGSPSPGVEEVYQRVATEIDRRLPGPGSQLGFPAAATGVEFINPRPGGDIDDQLAMAAAELEFAARVFNHHRPYVEGQADSEDLKDARARLRQAAVAYARAEQRFGVEVVRMLRR